MKKNIISFLCLISLITTVLPCSYALAGNTDGLNRKTSVLKALEIDDGTAFGPATNEYILTALSSFLYGKESKPDLEEFARDIGILKYGESYNGRKNVTKSEAVEYAVAVSGYKEHADRMGKNGYKTVASSLGITKGINLSVDTSISVDECRLMFYNMLEVSPMTATIENGQRKLVIENEHTILSKYRRIHRVYGLLTADSITSTDKSEGCGEGLVKIDDSLYELNNYVPESNLLGKNVEAYVTTGTDYEPDILYLGERTGKNEEIEISANDIEGISADYLTLEYFSESGYKKAKIAEIPRVIYNGVFYGKYTVSDFNPESGMLRLVDNDCDGKYDVIFINSYETVIVNAVDAYDKTIYNKFTSDGNLPMVTLEPDSKDVKYTISNGTGNVAFSEIKAGDVLSVARSKSAENEVIEILVCRETISGMLQGINEKELEIVIDDEKYSVSPAFLRFVNDDGGITLGTTYTFFYDALGNIAFWKKVTEDGYAVMRKAYFNEDNEVSYVSYMNFDGVWVDAPVAGKAEIDEIVYKTPASAYEALKNVKGQVVKLKFDSEGKIRNIETATETSNSDENNFTRTPMSVYTWRSGVNSFSEAGKCKYYLENDAKLVTIPQDYNSQSEYEVRDASGFFNADVDYKISLYDIDEFGFSGIVVMQYEPQVKSALFIVTGKSDIVVDGEPRAGLKGNAGDFENITLTGYNDTIFNDVEKGNIIKASFNSEGYADAYELVFDLENFTGKGGTHYTSQSYIAGKVIMIDAAKGRMLVDVNGEEYSFRIDNNVTVQMYNERGDIESSGVYNIIPGMNVFVNISWGNVKQMIIKR